MLRPLQSVLVINRLPLMVQGHPNDFVKQLFQSIGEDIPPSLIVNLLAQEACVAQIVRAKVSLDKKGAKKSQIHRNHPLLVKEMPKLSLSKIRLKGKQGSLLIDNITMIIKVSSRENSHSKERAVRAKKYHPYE